MKDPSSRVIVTTIVNDEGQETVTGIASWIRNGEGYEREEEEEEGLRPGIADKQEPY